MSYNNYRPTGEYPTSNGGGFSNGYNGRNENQQRNQYNANNNRQQQATKKHSGCSMRDSYKRGDGTVVNAPVIWGWNYSRSRGGLMKFVAVPCKKAGTKSDRWKRMLMTVTPAGGAAKWTGVVLWDTLKKRLHMSQLDMIANPGKNYWGRNYTPKNK